MRIYLLLSDPAPAHLWFAIVLSTNHFCNTRQGRHILFNGGAQNLIHCNLLRPLWPFLRPNYNRSYAIILWDKSFFQRSDDPKFLIWSLTHTICREPWWANSETGVSSWFFVFQTDTILFLQHLKQFNGNPGRTICRLRAILRLGSLPTNGIHVLETFIRWKANRCWLSAINSNGPWTPLRNWNRRIEVSEGRSMEKTRAARLILSGVWAQLSVTSEVIEIQPTHSKSLRFYQVPDLFVLPNLIP